MKKIYILPVAMLTFGLSTPVFADDTASVKTKSETSIKKEANGDYKKEEITSSTSTNDSGTTTHQKTKVEVEADADGDAEKKVTIETSTDPKGLMNKTKTVTTDSATVKDGKLATKHQKKINGKTVEDEETAEK